MAARSGIVKLHACAEIESRHLGSVPRHIDTVRTRKFGAFTSAPSFFASRGNTHLYISCISKSEKVIDLFVCAHRYVHEVETVQLMNVPVQRLWDRIDRELKSQGMEANDGVTFVSFERPEALIMVFGRHHVLYIDDDDDIKTSNLTFISTHTDSVFVGSLMKRSDTTFSSTSSIFDSYFIMSPKHVTYPAFDEIVRVDRVSGDTPCTYYDFLDVYQNPFIFEVMKSGFYCHLIRLVNLVRSVFGDPLGLLYFNAVQEELTRSVGRIGDGDYDSIMARIKGSIDQEGKLIELICDCNRIIFDHASFRSPRPPRDVKSRIRIEMLLLNCLEGRVDDVTHLITTLCAEVESRKDTHDCQAISIGRDGSPHVHSSYYSREMISILNGTGSLDMSSYFDVAKRIKWSDLPAKRIAVIIIPYESTKIKELKTLLHAFALNYVQVYLFIRMNVDGRSVFKNELEMRIFYDGIRGLSLCSSYYDDSSISRIFSSIIPTICNEEPHYISAFFRSPLLRSEAGVRESSAVGVQTVPQMSLKRASYSQKGQAAMDVDDA
jgi:hypothetical protein